MILLVRQLPPGNLCSALRLLSLRVSFDQHHGRCSEEDPQDDADAGFRDPKTFRKTCPSCKVLWITCCSSER